MCSFFFKRGLFSQSGVGTLLLIGWCYAALRKIFHFYEDALIISGERRTAQENQENVYYHEAQIRYGPFRVEVFIPSPVKREGVTARYENGFLWVDLPKALEGKPEHAPMQQTVIQE